LDDPDLVLAIEAYPCGHSLIGHLKELDLAVHEAAVLVKELPE